MGEKLSFDKCSLSVVEDKVAIMDHEDKFVKDPVRMKEIAVKTIDDYYKSRVSLGNNQLQKKLNKSNSPKPSCNRVRGDKINK